MIKINVWDDWVEVVAPDGNIIHDNHSVSSMSLKDMLEYLGYEVVYTYHDADEDGWDIT